MFNLLGLSDRLLPCVSQKAIVRPRHLHSLCPADDFRSAARDAEASLLLLLWNLPVRQ